MAAKQERQGETLYPAREVGRPGQLKDFKYVNCEVNGPAILQIAPGVIFDGCRFDNGTADTCLAIDNPLHGTIRLRNVAYVNCRFHNIGVVGPEDLIQVFIQQIRPSA